MKKIVLTGGGTAGHVTPNIALLPALKEAGFEIAYMGSYDGIEKKLIGDYDPLAWKSEIEFQPGKCFPDWLDMKDAYQVHFYTRMLFSCLVDADFLDTENFMQDTPLERGSGDSMTVLLERLKEYVKPWLKDTDVEINSKRSAILRSCLDGAKSQRGMYTLTVPTGGGKTVSSLAFALSQAARH